MISFVYLDVGGVANLDFSGTNKWNELRDELGVPPDKQAAYQAIWDEYMPKICVDYDVEKLVDVFRAELGLQIPRDYSLLNAFVARFEPNPSIWPVAQEIKQHVPVGLLTNMYIGMFEAILKTGMLPPVEWDVIIDSSLEGCQKPEAKIFEIAQAKAGVPGDQILFVDNSAEHVGAAKNFGWQTFLYNHAAPQQSSDELLAFFRAHAHHKQYARM